MMGAAGRGFLLAYQIGYRGHSASRCWRSASVNALISLGRWRRLGAPPTAARPHLGPAQKEMKALQHLFREEAKFTRTIDESTAIDGFLLIVQGN